MSMKWYKKQLQALKKETEEKDKSEDKKPGRSSGPKKPGGRGAFHNPVAQKNRNRSKTDLR